MKKLTVILFEDNLEIEKYTDKVFEEFMSFSEEKEFMGIWGEISFNNAEVLTAISDTVNHFINDTEKTELIFGCCKKDYNEIVVKIHTENCVVGTLSCEDL